METVAEALRKPTGKSNASRLHRVRLTLLCSSAAVLILHFGLRDRHERLFEIPPAGLVGIRNGTVYLAKRQPNKGLCTVTGINTESGRSVEIDRVSTLPGYEPGPTLMGNNLIITNVVGDRPSSGGRVMAIGKPTKVELRQKPLSGGGDAKVVDITSAPPRSTLTVSGDTIYWLDIHPPRLAMRKQNGRPIEVYIPTSSLIAFSTIDRTSRVVANNLHDRTMITSAEGGVFFLSTMGRPSRSGELYWAENGAQAAVKIGPYEGSANPLVCGDRIYWLENRQDIVGAQGGGRIASLVMTARHDGRDRRVLYRLPNIQGRTRYFINLLQNKGNLYLHLADVTGMRTAAAAPPSTLVRIDPKNPKQHEEVLRLPRNTEPFGLFDGDYYYFVNVSIKENWFDWSLSGLFPVRTFFLCRYKVT